MSELVLREVGLVVIGRNEGDRLTACLQSVVGCVQHIVYVDSGSTDGSCEMAADMGVHVIRLDMSVPFTAARARNEGWRDLMSRMPNLSLIQFVDGDCEMVKGWIDQAVDYLQTHPEYAVACGRLIEKYPEHSIYNRLCQYEWDTPAGEVKSCGGISMFRAAALTESNGFNDRLIAGEEPELCYRLRLAGWKVMRLPFMMAYHDAAIMKFTQWLRRSKRAGYSFAEVAWIHRRDAERFWVRETCRAVLYGLVIPVLILFFLFINKFIALALAALYPIQWIRLFYFQRSRVRAFSLVSLLVICKFPESAGVLKFYWSLLLRRKVSLIEYK